MDALEKMLQKMSKTHTPKNLNECSESNVCPICQNTGWEVISDGGHGTARECKCGIYQKMISRNRLSFANIPESFTDVRLQNFELNIYENDKSRKTAAVALKAINYWLENFSDMEERGMGLYLYSGTKGSGKTRMAASIANELIYEKRKQVKFSTSLQILNEIKSSWDKNSEYTESKLLDFFSTSQVLIIDDFGTENSEKQWINDKFYQIINNRYAERKVTIFTSNLRIDLLRYDERITNRIKERSFQIPFPEESIRDIMAKNNMSELIHIIKGDLK